MPAPIAIELSADEVDTLQKNLCSGKTPVRLRERSEIVLLASAGLLSVFTQIDGGVFTLFDGCHRA